MHVPDKVYGFYKFFYSCYIILVCAVVLGMLRTPCCLTERKVDVALSKPEVSTYSSIWNIVVAIALFVYKVWDINE